jgi:uncharacterized membrane protein
MSAYEFVLFVHVAAAVSLLGGSLFAAPAVRAGVRRAATVTELRTCVRMGRPLEVLNPVAALLVLASGTYLTQSAQFWSLGWVQVAVVFWIVNVITAAGFVKPVITAVALEARSDANEVIGARLDGLRRSPRWTIGGDILMANDAAMLTIMMFRPGLAASLLTVALANVLVAGGRLAFHRHRVPGAATAHAAKPQPF